LTINRIGRYEDALIYYDRAVELNPQNGKAWHDRGRLLENLGRKDEAEKCFKRAKELSYSIDGLK
jgi:Flp pilus assembly protein TadD